MSITEKHFDYFSVTEMHDNKIQGNMIVVKHM